MPAFHAASVSTDDKPTPPGSDEAREVYVDHAAKLLQIEIDRAARIEARGGAVVRTNISIIAAGLAIAAFLLGNDKTLSPVTIWVFGAGLVVLLFSTLAALFLQGKATKQFLTSEETLNDMAEEWWIEKSRPKALHDVMRRYISAIKMIRPQTNTRARWCNRAYYLQVAAGFIFLCAAGTEVVLRNF